MTTQELTSEIIEAIKAAHPDAALYKRTFNNQTYVVRTLSRQEYKQIQEWAQRHPNLPVDEYDEKVVSLGLVWPQIHPREAAAVLAGLFPTLSLLVQEKSLLLEPPRPSHPDAILSEVIQDRKPHAPPTDEEIAKVRAQTDLSIEKATLRGHVFIIRPLIRHEYNQLQKAERGADTNLLCVERTVLWPRPYDWANSDGGMADQLARHIMMLSGFEDPGEVQEL